MKLFKRQRLVFVSLGAFACLWLSFGYAQPTPQPKPPTSTVIDAKPTPEAPAKGILAKAADIKKAYKDKKLLAVSDIAIDDNFDLNDSSEGTLTFRNVTFGDDLHLSGSYAQISFEHCLFKRNVDFYVVRSPILSLQNCEFAGAAKFNIDVSGFTLRECDFSKTVNLIGAKFPQGTNGAINITRLSTKEPLRIFWSQFGDKWLRDLKGAINLGDPYEQESNKRQVLSELEFWKDNFNRLGHPRDAAEVNYEINVFAREQGISIEPYTTNWWLAYVLSWPSRYGTRPYRPLWIGLAVILIFAVFYWVTDPFSEADPKNPPTKPRTPRPLFSLMYSIESFIPILDVTGVKHWGWDLQPSYRWLGLVERLLGLLILYSAAYSLTYYVL
jgi:hypothetical protein